MIRCNLANILATKGLRITAVSKATGISRTTLTALASNYGQGIQFDTIETLCRYLQVRPGDLISFVPFCIKLKKLDFPKQEEKAITPESADMYAVFSFETWGRLQEFYVDVSISWIKDDNGKMKVLYIDLTLPEVIDRVEEDGIVWDVNSVDYDESNRFSGYFQEMGAGFLSDLQKEIEKVAIPAIAFIAGDASESQIIFSWPREYTPKSN